MNLFPQITEISRQLDDSICEICSHCGVLRMKTEREEEDYSQSKVLQTELRNLRNNFNGLKTAVDKVLDDHETRLRETSAQITTLNNQKYLIIGGGAVVGWLGSVLIRLFVK